MVKNPKLKGKGGVPPKSTQFKKRHGADGDESDLKFQTNGVCKLFFRRHLIPHLRSLFNTTPLGHFGEERMPIGKRNPDSLPEPNGDLCRRRRQAEGFSAPKGKPVDGSHTPPLVNYGGHGDFFDFSVRINAKITPLMMGPRPKILNENFSRPVTRLRNFPYPRNPCGFVL